MVFLYFLRFKKEQFSKKKTTFAAEFNNLTIVMHYAIIAAGEGSRLRDEGVLVPKPLVPLGGKAMVDRLMDIILGCGAESISIICNSQMHEVHDHLLSYHDRHPDLVLNIVVESTPSSMHSLARLSAVIPEGKVCVTTVDTIFHEREFAAYIRAFEHCQGGLFVVTPFVDDERPLWVACSKESAGTIDGRVCPVIRGFYDDEAQMSDDEWHFVSGGIYGIETSTAWPVLRQCLAEGQYRMRNFQRALVSAGVPLSAYVFGKVMDIDHADDLLKAEAWLDMSRKTRAILAVHRAPEFSPNLAVSDAAILQLVSSKLEEVGFRVEEVDEDTFGRMSDSELRSYELVIHMMRRISSLLKLQRLGLPAINAPQAVLTVAKSREMTLELLQQAGVAVPQWWAYEPSDDQMFQCEPQLQQLLPGWIKVMREGGTRHDDVTWVETPLDADARVMELAAQRVPDIVVTRHVEGDLLKVYAVMPDFVYAFYPQEMNYTKFGTAEQHNTALAHIEYSDEELRAIAGVIASTFGIEIFGFDVVIEPNGHIVVIDVNDWPSFSAYRQKGASAIAALITDSLAKMK